MCIRLVVRNALVCFLIRNKLGNSFKPTDLDSNWPASITELSFSAFGCLISEDKDPSIIISLLIQLAQKENLITKPVADAILDGCNAIINSVDNMSSTIFINLDKLPFSAFIYKKFVIYALKIGLCSRFILTSINQTRPDIISPNEYKIIDPLTVTESHYGDTIIQKIEKILYINAQEIAKCVDSQYLPLARGFCLMSTAVLRHIINNLRSVYGGLQ